MRDHFVCFSLLTKSSIKYKSTTYNGFLDLLNIYIFSSCDGPSKCTMPTAQVNLIQGEKTKKLMPGSLSLEEMEEVVGILYNLDGSEKVTLVLCYSRS